MSDYPLAYFITWRTYGSWLPGDPRGWLKNRRGFQPPNPDLHVRALLACREPPLVLNLLQREVVEATIQQHCRIRRWPLHAKRCLSNHVHVVVSALTDPDTVMSQLKAWCTRRLHELQRRIGGSVRSQWWAERGNKRKIYDLESLARAIYYVEQAQDGSARPEVPAERHGPDLRDAAH